MSGDPRWKTVRDFLEWFEDNRSELDPEEYLARFGDYTASLEDIAGDQAAAADDRTAAREILEDMAAQARVHTADAVSVLAEIANDDEASAGLRYDARRDLRRVAEQMRVKGTDISHWISTPIGKPH